MLFAVECLSRHRENESRFGRERESVSLNLFGRWMWSCNDRGRGGWATDGWTLLIRHDKSPRHKTVMFDQLLVLLNFMTERDFKRIYWKRSHSGGITKVIFFRVNERAKHKKVHNQITLDWLFIIFSGKRYIWGTREADEKQILVAREAHSMYTIFRFGSSRSTPAINLKKILLTFLPNEKWWRTWQWTRTTSCYEFVLGGCFVSDE